MEPLKPQEVQTLVDLGADPAEVEEYESLLASRFSRDPDLEESPDDDSEDFTTELVRGGSEVDSQSLDATRTPRTSRRALRERVDQLSRKIFPNGIKQGEEG